MKTRKLSSAAAIFAVAVSLLTFTNSAIADTYQIFDLSGPDHLFGEIQGIDAAGDVVFRNNSTYFTFTNGVLVNTSNSLPNLVFDNGNSCLVPAGFLIAGNSVCNNGRTFFGGILNPNGEPNGAYVGSISNLTLLTPWFDINQGVLNSSGDVVWRNLQTERVYQAINLTAHVPEPARFVLLGTGSALLINGVRRKLSTPL
jgi:hypothetical protein